MMKRASVLGVAGVVGLTVAGTVTGAAPRFQIQTPPHAAPPVVYAAADDIPEPVRLETFRIVWETVRDHYFDPATRDRSAAHRAVQAQRQPREA
jgi:hypothetical protein